MVDIMAHLHSYVPTLESTKSIKVPGCEETKHLTQHNFHKVLLGGDQLTVTRAISSQRVRRNSETPLDQLQGIILYTYKLCSN